MNSNDPQSTPPASIEALQTTCQTWVGEAESFVRRHPVASVLTTLGVGCALGIMARELMAPPPTARQRAYDLLEDIQARVSGFTQPMAGKVTHLAEDGASAIRRGFDSAADSRLGSRIKQWFS
jgi:hypothetical protein